MKVLLVYPKNPVTYWGFQYALKFVSKKAAYPPLGLLTVAAILPQYYEKKLIDMNVETLNDHDLLWADYVFISAMVVQKDSVKEVIDRCKELGVKIVAGGPLFTSEFELYDDIDHLILNEGEITIPLFLSDLEHGNAEHSYTSKDWADLLTVPVPEWSLINVKKYASMSIQYSRGCPFNCDFCNITTLFGNMPRTKDPIQLIGELNAIYESGWRSSVFFVDDNFIGNKRKLMDDVLPAIINWMERHDYPFHFSTEASINLSDDVSLMNMMVKGGFSSVFIGIETPDEDSLTECKKTQNKNRDLIYCIQKIQRAGLEVQGGFIVGFDHDNPSIFNRMVEFIQDSGIAAAMVGLLNAPKGTQLYQRLLNEGRMTEEFSGDNTNYTMNFTPKMDKDLLVKGYHNIVTNIYSPKYYYKRVRDFLKRCDTGKLSNDAMNATNILAFFKSVVRLGILGKERRYYWELLIWSLFKRPKLFPAAVRFSIYGFHFRKVYESVSFASKTSNQKDS